MRIQGNLGLHSAILQACKQIYREALPTLHSRTTSNSSTPRVSITPVRQTSTCCKTVTIHIPPKANPTPWAALLHPLSTNSNGLRNIHISFNA
ncbi:hypothetical protein BDW75DRAFT_214347 [Aspergillus navahoensis]